MPLTTGAQRLRCLAAALALAAALPAGALPYAFVARDSDAVDVVDLEGGTLAVRAVLGDPTVLVSVAALPDGFAALVVGSGAGIWRVDAAGSAAKVTGADAVADASGIALSPDGLTALVAQRNGGVWVVRLAPGGASVDAGSATPVALLPASGFTGPTGVAFAPDGSKAYVASEGGVLSVVSLAGPAPAVTAVASGGAPASVPLARGVAVSQDGQLAAAVSRDGDLVLVDTATDSVITRVDAGPGARDVVFHPDDGRLYVSLAGPGAVAEVDLGTLLTRPRALGGGLAPEGLAVSADGRRLVLACADAVAVLDTAAPAAPPVVVPVAGAARSYGAMAAPPLPIPAGLVSLWLGEGSGLDGDAAAPQDLTPPARLPRYGPGRSGQGFLAAGADGWRAAGLGGLGGLPLGSAPRTLVAWLRLSALPAAGSAALAGWGDPAAARHFALEVTQAGEPLFRGGGGTLTGAPGAVGTGAWHHLAAVWDGGTARIYLDGQGATAGPLTLDTALPATGAGLWIGAPPPGAAAAGVDGTVDDVAVFDRALSAEEIRAIAGAGAFQVPRLEVTFAAGAGGSLSGLLAQRIPRGGATFPVDAVPELNHRFAGWTGPGGFSSPDGSLVVSPLLAAGRFTAAFELVRYLLEFVAGFGGTLSGPELQDVEHGGASTPVTAQPDPFFHFVRWEDLAGQPVSTDPVLVRSPVTEAATFTAVFALDTYPLTFTADPGGDLIGATEQVVEHGGSATEVTALAQPRFLFIGWEEATLGPVASDVSLLVTNVTGPGSYVARFEQVLFPVLATAEGATLGVAEPEGMIGQQVEVPFLVDFGFAFHHLDGTCGGTPGAVVNRVLPVLTDPLAGTCTLHAVFLPTGDATPGDGTVTAADVRSLLLHLLGIAPVSANPRWLDVAPLAAGLPAPDGRLDAGDAAVVARRASGAVSW